MKTLHKILFFFFLVVIAFIPGGILISFILLLLYYAPTLLKSLNAEICEEKNYQVPSELTHFIITQQDSAKSPLSKMDSYSDDTLEEMK